MGLRLRMAVSYVLVTLAAVLVVEGILLAVLARPTPAPPLTERDQVNGIRGNAITAALKLSGHLSTDGELTVGSPVAVPAEAGCAPQARAGAVTLLLSQDRRIMQSSSPGCFPIGSDAPIPPGAAPTIVASGSRKTPDGPIVWATEPVVRVSAAAFSADVSDPADLLTVPGAQNAATLYLQAPLDTASTRTTPADLRPLLVPGLVVLAAALPVGVLFGFATMHRPVRRLRRLASTTQAIADGDLQQRIPVYGSDELARLEDSVNRMADQLTEAITAERDLAAVHARAGERSRIARELHDSVSQQLFSLRLLAGGIRNALPEDSSLRPHVDTLVLSADTATREMRALLLELRPVGLDDAGLAGALDQLARAYRTRLGLAVTAALEDDVPLSEDRQHALLRIAQEAVANAVHHGAPTEITIELTPDGLTIHDDGVGFDPQTPTSGMGLILMRERAAEVGIDLTITSAPANGTTVEARLP